MVQVRKAWHHDGVIWVRFPGIVHGLTMEEAQAYVDEIKSSMDKCVHGINEDKIY